MIAPKSGWARKLRRQIFLLRLGTFALPVAAFGLGALAVGLTLRDGPQQCLQDVRSFARHIESSLPPDPTFVSFAFQQMTDAARLCGDGNSQGAQDVLEALRESLRV